MPELDEKARAEEFQRKLEEVRQKTLTEELVRLEALANSQVSDLVAARRSEEDSQFQTKLREAEGRRSAAEAALRSLESETAAKLTAGIQKRLEARRREEEELRRKAEEERLRQESQRKKADEEARVKAESEQKKREEEQRRAAEAAKKKADEEARMKAEAEQRKRKEEERQRAEAERRKKDEEQRKANEIEQKRRQEEERLRHEQEARRKAEEETLRKQEEQRKAEETERAKREEEARRQEQLAEEARAREKKEREDRIKSLLANAKAFHREQNYRDAALEVAKVLMNDPKNAEALALDAKIKADEATPMEPAPESAPSKTPAGDKKPGGGQKKKARVPVLLVTVIVAGALLVGGILFFQLKHSVFPSTTNLAVLPLLADPTAYEESIIGSSLSELVVRQFERSPQANVLGYPSALGLARRTTDATRAAFGLGSNFVLKGSIARAGETYSLRLQLLDSTGSSAWEKSYAKPADGLAALPGEIASDVREALRIREAAGAANTRTAAGGAAYILFLKGLELLHHASPEDLQNAYALLDQATAQEANFGEAMSAKAEAIARSFELGAPLVGTTLDDAKNLSAEAIALDPSQPEGYIARGIVYDELKQYKMALQQFDNALQRAPNNSMAAFRKARVYLKVGQHQEGMDALTAAFRINPRDPAILTLIAQTYQLARATQEGFPYLETALPYVADSTAFVGGPVADAILTDATLTLAQSERVEAALQRTLTANQRDFKSMYRLARVYQGSGKGMEALTLLNSAEQVLKEELQSRPQNAEAAAYLALTLTRSGQFPEALVLGQRLLLANPNDAGIKYRIAQLYSLQMYSGKTMSVDEEVRKLCTSTLRDALALDYRIDELANGDFYNMYEHSDFKTIIQMPLK